ncbi:hypothetical protein HS7_17680 [Sulfolobales archaeon HS-7]|nr:hypothetical protein HS7_17680 [Sulfolobales archaeon HS-7]
MNGFVSFLRYTGIFAAVLAWVIIGLCVVINPWFKLTVNAFSDLGGPRATDPYLYNVGLIVVALFTALYGSYLVYLSQNKVETVSATLVIIAAIFLALIGVYHEGTYPHVFVSTWFFIQFDMAVLVNGLSLLFASRDLGILMIFLFLIATVVAATVHWPSAATIEAWGIGCIDVWIILSYFRVRQIMNLGGSPRRR